MEIASFLDTPSAEMILVQLKPPKTHHYVGPTMGFMALQ